MIVDGRSVPADQAIAADICVVGGGPAGISLVLQFLKSPGVTVVLVESGGRVWDDSTQELSGAESTGQRYFPMKETHLRVLGGTTLAYGGFCTELSDLDFEERAWVPESGWPFPKAALNPYRDGSYELLGTTAAEESESRGTTTGDIVWKQVVASHPPLRFGQTYGPQLAKSVNVTTYLHSTVTNIELDSGGRHVNRVVVKCLGGSGYRIAARHYVLAGGGIEVPRLLLASSDIAAAGVGNSHGNVGRYFQEHPRVFDRYSIPASYNTRTDMIAGVAGTLDFSRLGLSEDVQRSEGLLDYHSNLTFGFSGQDHAQWEAVRRLGVATVPPWRYRPYYQVMGGGRNGVRWQDVRTAAMRPDRAALSLLGLKGLLPRSMRKWVEVASSIEQVPQRENRVVIVGARDALGMPRAELRWQLHDLERLTYERGRDLVLRELDQDMPGLASNRMNDPDQWPDHVLGTWHHSGTTRMHSDPRRGVVDEDCKVHGVDNLSIASSSTFPTSGSTAPTFTILCLALRLAACLKRQLRV